MQRFDFSHLKCPYIVLEVKKSLNSIAAKDEIEVITKLESADDLIKFCLKTGNKLINQYQDIDNTITIIKKR